MICSPFTAVPEPLNEQFVSQKRFSALSSPNPLDHPRVPAGAAPARMLLPPATNRYDGQSQSESSSAIRSSAKPLPMAPRSNSNRPSSQRIENSARFNDHFGSVD